MSTMYKCSGCKKLNCSNYATYGMDCLGKKPKHNTQPIDPVCVSCNKFCGNLKAYGMDCLGYRNGIERSERNAFYKKHYSDSGDWGYDYV
jgi:hypothetical protein